MHTAPASFAAMKKRLARDIQLAILTDPVDAGQVYVDLEGFSSRFLADIKDGEKFSAFARRFFDIIETLHGSLGEYGEAPRRGLTFSFDSSAASNHQRIAAAQELKDRLSSHGCPAAEIARLLAPSCE